MFNLENLLLHLNGRESVVFLPRASTLLPPPPILSLGDENHSFPCGNGELVLRAICEKTVALSAGGDRFGLGWENEYLQFYKSEVKESVLDRK